MAISSADPAHVVDADAAMVAVHDSSPDIAGQLWLNHVFLPAGGQFGEKLVQFAVAVHRPGPDAGHQGMADLGPRADGVVIVPRSPRRQASDPVDFPGRGHVEAAHAGFDQRFDDPARRIRLHGVEDVGL